MKKKNNIKKGNVVTLIEIFNLQLNKKIRLGCTRTASNYKTCIRKLTLFLKEDASTFTLRQVTPEWVESWVKHLTTLHPNHPETVDFYFRISRAMYNLALESMKDKQGYVALPFKGVKIKKYQPSKRALTAEEMKKLLEPDFREELKPSLKETLDVLSFIFYAQGMVFRDVYNLRWEMVDREGRIRYTRSKTGNPVEVSILPEIHEIMERYRGKHSPFIFPFLHRRKEHTKNISEEAALRCVNQHASHIGKLVGLSLPLSTYVMRHTWATLMLESGKPIELISQCLGHSNIRTTQIYLSRISSEKVDTEINDMLNQMLRDTSGPAGKKKRKSRETVTTKTSAPTRNNTILNEEKETEIVESIPTTNKRKEKKHHKRKKNPFLAKKKKNLNLPFLCKKQKFLYGSFACGFSLMTDKTIINIAIRNLGISSRDFGK
jgi:integrase